jgi:hypothetical protein
MAAGKDAPPLFNRKRQEILQAREDNNPARGSRNLYDHNTTGFLIPMILT